ncbi:MAG: TonB-dependent receptor, partial [Polyangiales bacterium]
PQGTPAAAPEGGADFGAMATVQSDIRQTQPSAVSDLELELGALRRVPRADAQSLLTLAPGVLLTQHGGTGHTASMFLRGFDAEEGEDLEMTVEGVPLNEVSNAHGHGYADTLFIMPELVTSLRVVQGPFDPAQGDFAVAGSADYRLGLRERGLHLSSAYGSFQRRRLALYWGPEGQQEGTFVGVNFNAGDGFGPNRAYENAAAMAQYEGRAQGDKLRYRLLAFGAAGQWDTAGVIREDDFNTRSLPCAQDEDSQFECLYDPAQGGSSQRLGLAGSLEWRKPRELTELMLFGMGRGLEIRENFTGFLGDPRTDGGPQRGDLAEQRYQAGTGGARTRHRKRFAWLGREQQVEAGAYLRFDQAETRTDRLRDELGVPYRTDFDRDVQQVNVAGYLRGDLELLSWLGVAGGLRTDFFGYQVTDHNRPDSDRIGARLSRESATAAGIAVQPRGALRFHLRSDLDYLISAGLGARSSDAAALSEGELAPFARVTALESGFVYTREGYKVHAPLWRRRWALQGRASAFVTHVEQDLVFDPAAGRNTVIGPSNRSGIMALGRLRLSRWLDTQASVSYTRAHTAPPDASAAQIFAGERLPFIPTWLGRLDAAFNQPFVLWGQSMQWNLALGLSYVGQRPLPLNTFTNPFTVVDASTGLRWRALEFALLIDNLLNTRYRAAEFNYASNFQDPNLPPSQVPTR